jgi:hypothetical protein
MHDSGQARIDHVAAGRQPWAFPRRGDWFNARITLSSAAADTLSVRHTCAELAACSLRNRSRRS